MDALQFYESSSDSDVDEETERRGFCVKRFKPAAEDKTESSSALPLSLPPPPPELFSSIPDAGTSLIYSSFKWKNLSWILALF